MEHAQPTTLRAFVPSCLRAFLFPPPRRAVTWHTFLPLVGFALVFAATCVLLDLFDVLMFANPWAFLFMLIVPWLWWQHTAGYSGLSGWRSMAALLTRLSLAGLFVMLLAEPRAVRNHDAVSMMYVLDLSMSIGNETSDQALAYINKVVSEKPVKDKVGLVMFARNAAVELPPSTLPPVDGEMTMTLQIDRDGTNVEKALSLASAMLPPESQGRVTLISDGVETEGNLISLLDELKSRGIAVDVLRVDYEYEHEVWIERLELPRNVKAGETYEAVAILSSKTDGKGDLVLLENGQKIFGPEPVEYSRGKNRYSIPIYLREAGYYEYTAMILPDKDEAGKVKDGFDKNNKAISFLNLKGEGKVLIVYDAGDANAAQDWQPLVDELRRAERAVQLQNAYEFPTDPLALLPYDCIVFVDVPADMFVASQFAALKDAVYNQGSGFLMVGGENSFGPGGYHRTDVEEILPVTMDVTQKKILPKGALAVVLHTCEFPQGNYWGKEITKSAIKVLGDQDEVGVLVYDFQGGEQWLFDLTPASEYPRLAKLINAAQIGDMPVFGTTMLMGLNSLRNSDAATKHMIIVSDGDAQPPSPQLLQQFIDAKITVATVAVFPHGGSTQTMQAIASVTGGNFYQPNDPNLLPSIFIKEAKTLKRSMIQNKTFTPAVSQAGIPSPVLKGIDGFPQLHGYVITTLKPQANMILQVPESEDDEPVLAIWRNGLGRTAAFTSDLGANWAKDWLQWDKFNAFVKQLVIDISRVKEAGQLRMRTFATSGQGVVLIEDYAPQASFLDVGAEVAGPRDTRQRIELKQIGPRRYEGRFALTGQGRYQVMAVGAGDGREERAHGGFVVPYSQEYLRFHADRIALDQIVDKTGGQLLSGDETGAEIFARGRRTTRSDQPIADWFLVALAILIPLDVALRRVQIDWNFFRARKHTPSDEMFTQLLRTKRTVQTQLDSRRDQRAAPMQGQPLTPAERASAADKPKPTATQPTAQTPDDEPASTTERLLAARKKLRDDEAND